jgi:hypothetical protein
MNKSLGKQLGDSQAMAHVSSPIRRIAATLVACSAIALALGAPLCPAPAGAEPIFKRGRPPIYPYFYSPGRPGGYSFYFGFVPYQKGDYETQALQRQFPSMNYPPSMRYWNPQKGSPIP